LKHACDHSHKHGALCATGVCVLALSHAQHTGVFGCSQVVLWLACSTERGVWLVLRDTQPFRPPRKCPESALCVWVLAALGECVGEWIVM
jgi:hypothetical protein